LVNIAISISSSYGRLKIVNKKIADGVNRFI